jgi:hypothetical protein
MNTDGPEPWNTIRVPTVEQMEAVFVRAAEQNAAKRDPIAKRLRQPRRLGPQYVGGRSPTGREPTT